MSGSFIVVQYFTRSPKARKHSSANTPKSSLRQDSISRQKQKQKQARCLYVLEWIKAENYESESYTTLLLRNPPYSSSRACGMSQWYSVTKGSIPTWKWPWTWACMFIHVRVRAKNIYIHTCVRVQNRGLLNARRANDYTILEQLVDEIIVISDPLFIDSSVSWWSFWRHLIMEIRVQPKPIITETIHPLLSQLGVLIQLTGKYAWPGNRKTIQVHSHVFEMLNIFLHACM